MTVHARCGRREKKERDQWDRRACYCYCWRARKLADSKCDAGHRDALSFFFRWGKGRSSSIGHFVATLFFLPQTLVSNKSYKPMPSHLYAGPKKEGESHWRLRVGVFFPFCIFTYHAVRKKGKTCRWEYDGEKEGTRMAPAKKKERGNRRSVFAQTPKDGKRPHRTHTHIQK